MRLNINLASNPYQDVRRFLLLWGGATVIVLVCTISLVWTAINTWRESRQVNAKISETRAEITQLENVRKQAVAMLQSPQNTGVVTDSKFLNVLIARKAFSWTRVFMTLEQIMPPRIHVVSIAPDLSGGHLFINLKVAGTSRDAAIELVKRLEQSSAFRDSRIVSERAVTEKGSTDTIEFQIAAMYIPPSQAQAADAQTTAEVSGGQR